MNWLRRLLGCRDRNLERLLEFHRDRYREELLRQIDHVEELLEEKGELETEIERLRAELAGLRSRVLEPKGDRGFEYDLR